MQATMVVLKGDADQLYRAWRDKLLPVAQPLAREYGWVRSVAARGDGELVVFNLWSDADGLDRALADPAIARVQDAELAPLATAAPEIRRLDVLDDLDL